MLITCFILIVTNNRLIGDIGALSQHRFKSSFSLITSCSSSLLHAHPPFVGILTVVYRLVLEPLYPLPFPLPNCRNKKQKMCFHWSVNVNCDKVYSLFCQTLTLKNSAMPMPTNRDDNSMLYPRLHSLLTICLSPQTWSFHHRQSQSTPVGP